MNSILFLTLIYILSVGQVFCQQPSAGATSLVGAITGGSSDASPGPTRWIEFMDDSNHWSKLGNQFTVEAWVWQSTQGNSSWQPIISRHPGLNQPRENAHFSIAVRNKASLEVYAGCGCSEEVCGEGYFLSAPFTPGVWQHVAVTFDGDASSEFSSKNATLYINGVRVAQNSWGSHNAACSNGSMPYQLPSDVKVGYLDDQDIDVGSEGNPQKIKGWWGRIDEIRFWLEVRSNAQIADYHDIGLKGTENNLLAYYQFSPSMEVLQDPTAKKEIMNKVGDYLHGVPLPNPYDPQIFLQTTNPPILSFGRVLGQSDDDNVPSLPNVVEFESWPPSEEATYWLNPIYSPALQGLITSGMAQVTVDPQNVQSFTVSVVCPDNNCSSYENNWRQYYVDYQAIYDGILTPDTSRLFLRVTANCPSGIYDECGECEGDNTLCQCVEYHSFDSQRMTHILLEWSLTNLKEEVSFALDTLRATQTILDMSMTDDLGALRQQITDIMAFYNDDLTDYCGDLSDFQTDLHNAIPRAADGMLDNSAHSNADGAIPPIPKFAHNL